MRAALIAVIAHRRKRLLLGASVPPSAEESSLAFASGVVDADGVTTLGYTGTVRDELGAAIPNLSGLSVEPIAWYDMADVVADAVVSVSPSEIEDNDTETATISVLLHIDIGGGVFVPWAGVPAAAIVISSTGTGNTIVQPSAATSASGITSGTIRSSVAEAKTISVAVNGSTLTDTAALTVSGTPTPPDDIFAEDESDNTGGWDIGPTENAQVAITAVADAGPDGAGDDVIRCTFADAYPGGGDFGFGHGGTLVDAAFGYGQSVYLRGKNKFGAGTNFRFEHQNGSGDLAGVGRLKYIILNDHSSGTTSRVIISFWMEYNGGSPRFTMRVEKGGGVDPGTTGYITLDNDFHAWQVAVDYSSSEGVADGGYRLWFDNTTEGSPDISVTGIVVNADVDPGYVKLGAYLNNGLYSDGVLVMDRAQFAIKDAFTAGWEV